MKRRVTARPVPMVGPISSYLPQVDGEPSAAALPEDLKYIFNVGQRLGRGDFRGGAAFYEKVPKDSRAFLSAADLAVQMAVSSRDRGLFEQVLKDVTAYPKRYGTEDAQRAEEIFQVWLHRFLRVPMDLPAWVDDPDFTCFQPEWFHSVAYLVMGRLWWRRRFSEARHLGNLMLAFRSTALPFGYTMDVGFKMAMGELYHEEGLIDEAYDCYCSAVRAAKRHGVIRPMLGRLLGPKAPLEMALRDNAPDLLEKVKAQTDDYFRNLVHFHNLLTGDTVTEKLTVREYYLACALRRGIKYREIGSRMGVSAGRLNTIVSKLYEKLGIHGTDELSEHIW